jgi:hypothetical protein
VRDLLRPADAVDAVPIRHLLRRPAMRVATHTHGHDVERLGIVAVVVALRPILITVSAGNIRGHERWQEAVTDSARDRAQGIFRNQHSGLSTGIATGFAAGTIRASAPARQQRAFATAIDA